MKIKPQFIILPAILAAIALAGWQIERARSAKSSVLSGVFETRPASLASRAAGRVLKLMVQEGDSAQPGQALVILKSDSAQTSFEAAAAARDQALAKLRELQSGFTPEQIAAQKALLNEASAQEEKVVRGARAEEIADARARLAGAEAKFTIVREGARDEEISKAEAAFAQAQARLAVVRRGPSVEEVKQLEAQLRGAESRELLQKKELDRATRLEEEGAISKSSLDALQTAFESAHAESDRFRQALKRAANGSPPEEVREAESALAQAGESLKLIKAGPRKEEIQAAAAEVDRARASLDLLLHGSRVEDKSAAAAKVSQARARLVEVLKGPRQEEVDQAKAALETAEAKLKDAMLLAAEAKVAAEEQGVVEKLLVAVGDLVQPGQPLVIFSRPQDIWIRVYLPGVRLADVSVGDLATLAVDGVPELLEAKVSSIATQGEFTPSALQSPEDRGEQAFAVTLRLAKPDRRVKPGMSATVKKLGSWK